MYPEPNAKALISLDHNRHQHAGKNDPQQGRPRLANDKPRFHLVKRRVAVPGKETGTRGARRGFQPGTREVDRSWVTSACSVFPEVRILRKAFPGSRIGDTMPITLLTIELPPRPAFPGSSSPLPRHITQSENRREAIFFEEGDHEAHFSTWISRPSAAPFPVTRARDLRTVPPVDSACCRLSPVPILKDREALFFGAGHSYSGALRVAERRT